MEYYYIRTEFLYIDPLKQGLKRKGTLSPQADVFVFIHRSIKTRIETAGQATGYGLADGFYT